MSSGELTISRASGASTNRSNAPARRHPRSVEPERQPRHASNYRYNETLHAFEKSARKLGVDRIDLLILHPALPSAFDRTLEAYRALETLLADRKVHATGVSNFMVGIIGPGIAPEPIGPTEQRTKRTQADTRG